MERVDVVVVGGGPAGITGAVTAINRRLETLVIAERWGGQTTYSMELEDTDVHSVMDGDLDGFIRAYLLQETE